MKKPLNKRFPRELKKNKGRYLAIFLLMTLTIIFGSGFLVASDSAKYTMEQDWKDNHVEDGQFTSFYELDEANLKTVTEQGAFVEKEFFKDFTINTNKGLNLRVYKNRSYINAVSVHEGKLPSNSDEIAIDRLFAKNTNILVGNSLKLDGIKFKVVGTISMPDYSSLFKSNNTMVMDALHFGIAVVNADAFKSFANKNLIYRYSYYFNERDLGQNEIGNRNNEIRKKLAATKMLSSFVTAEDNQARTFCSNDFGGDIPMMKTLIFIIITIMAFVFGIISNATIDEEASIIGTLRANGYTKGEILKHYIALPVIVTIASAIVGNIIGYTLMVKPFAKIYYNSYCLAPLDMRWNLDAFILTTAIPVFIMLTTNYLMLRNKLSISPLRFLRKDLKKGTNKKPVKLPNWKFIHRFQTRIILQNKAIFLMLFIGIFFASLLLVFGLGLLPIVENYVDTVDKTMMSEYQYILKSPVEVDGGEKMTVSTFKTFYKLGSRDVDVTVYGLLENSKYFSSKVLPDDNSILLGSGFSGKLDYNTNDTITFTDSYDKEIKYKLKSSGIVDYNSGYAIFMSQNKLNKLLNKDANYYNGYLSNKKLDIDENYIAMTVTKSDMVNAAQQMTASMNDMMIMVKSFSVLIYIVLMYILTKVVIDKNAIYMSFMKVFGYESKEIRRLYLNASTFTVMISLILCLPLEMQVMKALLVYAMSDVEGYLPFYLPWYLLIEVILAGMISYLLINIRHIRKVNRIRMGDALKNRE
ncbi:protein of unknown function DUF214 [Ruminiclostridium papyrosolvens DSM 2782]|uniref:ABC3 transporter permease C-terminal domain-containing protein n=1 Tax=Ruminiclostridium papyrosolvens DSM 2782 TaxID=588581 RepID=F1TBW2_9FIRM|nr:FtsX-like permease family protein [Ruminiclostridium papyrosolvens]EGD48133.1 protein of unknown function DUF214 [Ruminiclostridium papyrosolvens DSM 2782]WES34985.1 ABC transporter permease [Ruminiclostridium papyrosolvens DSM 2782]